MRTIDRKEDMNTFADRKDRVTYVLTDPEFVITAKEKLTFVYHWYRYENALRQRMKATRTVKKYKDLLNEDAAAFLLRKKLNDL